MLRTKGWVSPGVPPLVRGLGLELWTSGPLRPQHTEGGAGGGVRLKVAKETKDYQMDTNPTQVHADGLRQGPTPTLPWTSKGRPRYGPPRTACLPLLRTLFGPHSGRTASKTQNRLCPGLRSLAYDSIGTRTRCSSPTLAVSTPCNGSNARLHPCTGLRQGCVFGGGGGGHGPTHTDPTVGPQKWPNLGP